MRTCAVGMAALLAWSGAAFGFSLGLARVFINELHHDNAGGDHNAAVEIAGPVGQDLAGWSLVFCNGSNSRAYATVPLSSALVDEGAGFGTLLAAVSQNTLQNGPDGLALVHAGGSTQQFLSYEGTFTALDGPAQGMASTYVGVSESSATPPAASLQLKGDKASIRTSRGAPRRPAAMARSIPNSSSSPPGAPARILAGTRQWIRH